MLSWVLFYTSTFDMLKTPMIDVYDPDGLVRSQVVESPAGGLKVTLNGADSNRTLAGRFLTKSFGASVVIVNGSPTEMDGLADVVVRGSISEVLPAIL